MLEEILKNSALPPLSLPFHCERIMERRLYICTNNFLSFSPYSF